MKGYRLTVLASFVLSFLPASHTLAENKTTGESQQKSELTPQQYDDLASTIVAVAGISPRSKIKDRFLSKLKNTDAKRGYATAQKTDTIIKHLKFDQGIAFPSAEELKKAKELSSKFKTTQRPVVEASARGMNMVLPEEKEKALRKELVEKRSALFTPKSIPKCREDKTLQAPNNSEIPNEIAATIDDEKKVLFDILYLSPDSPAVVDKLTGPDELFGEETLIHTYKDKMGDYPSLLASQNEVECLPFRLRVTRDSLYQYYGKDALKNYDKSEKGTFHFHVKNKLHRFF